MSKKSSRNDLKMIKTEASHVPVVALGTGIAASEAPALCGDFFTTTKTTTSCSSSHATTTTSFGQFGIGLKAATLYCQKHLPDEKACLAITTCENATKGKFKFMRLYLNTNRPEAALSMNNNASTPLNTSASSSSSSCSTTAAASTVLIVKSADYELGYAIPGHLSGTRVELTFPPMSLIDFTTSLRYLNTYFHAMVYTLAPHVELNFEVQDTETVSLPQIDDSTLHLKESTPSSHSDLSYFNLHLPPRPHDMTHIEALTNALMKDFPSLDRHAIISYTYSSLPEATIAPSSSEQSEKSEQSELSEQSESDKDNNTRNNTSHDKDKGRQGNITCQTLMVLLPIGPAVEGERITFPLTLVRFANGVPLVSVGDSASIEHDACALTQGLLTSHTCLVWRSLGLTCKRSVSVSHPHHLNPNPNHPHTRGLNGSDPTAISPSSLELVSDPAQTYDGQPLTLTYRLLLVVNYTQTPHPQPLRYRTLTKSSLLGQDVTSIMETCVEACGTQLKRQHPQLFQSSAETHRSLCLHACVPQVANTLARLTGKTRTLSQGERHRDTLYQTLGLDPTHATDKDVAQVLQDRLHTILLAEHRGYERGENTSQEQILMKKEVEERTRSPPPPTHRSTPIKLIIHGAGSLFQRVSPQSH